MNSIGTPAVLPPPGPCGQPAGPGRQACLSSAVQAMENIVMEVVQASAKPPVLPAVPLPKWAGAAVGNGAAWVAASGEVAQSMQAPRPLSRRRLRGNGKKQPPPVDPKDGAAGP